MVRGSFERCLMQPEAKIGTKTAEEIAAQSARIARKLVDSANADKTLVQGGQSAGRTIDIGPDRLFARTADGDVSDIVEIQTSDSAVRVTGEHREPYILDSVSFSASDQFVDAPTSHTKVSSIEYGQQSGSDVRGKEAVKANAAVLSSARSKLSEARAIAKRRSNHVVNRFSGTR
jgi:hypothetical protein